MSVNAVSSTGALTPIATRGQFTQYSTIPTASVDLVDRIIQYIGATNQNYTNGYFYKCVLDNNVYIWQNIAVQSGSGGSDNIINGYFNSSDNLFYEESTYTTPITGESNVLYISLDTDFSYRYNGLIFVRVDNEIDDTTNSSTKTWSSNKISSEINGIDGSTVTPTDDIQTWLKCAELDEAYTTLSAVLADDDVMEKLFRSENASNYLVRSTTWASDITADQTAMILIGKNDYCADKLLNDSTWSTAISASTYWNEVLLKLIPKMTSNISPYGVADGSTYSSSHQPYMAFDDNLNTHYETNASSGFLSYKFSNPVIIGKIALNSYGETVSVKNGKIQYSSDGTTWNDAISNVFQNTSNTQYLIIPYIGEAYEYWRLECIDTYGSTFTVKELQFYGRASKTTIYSAANDIVSFVDDEGAKVVKTDSTGKGEIVIVCKPNTDITFTSSVAKDPNNLSKNYSKVVTIKTGEPVYIMPNKNVLYWWGYKSSNLEDISTANGWTYTSYTFDTPTYNTNSIDLPVTSSMHTCGVGTKTSCKLKKATLVSNGIVGYTFNNFYTCGSIGILSNKNFNSASLARCGQGIEKTELEMSSFGDYYIQTFVNNGQSSSIYALWYDSDDADDKAEISAIGNNEDKPTASKAYVMGEHFYKNGKFCTCTQAIAQGATFTLGTNYVEGNISDFLTIKTHEFTPVTTYFSGEWEKTIYKYGRVGIADISGRAKTSIPGNTFTTIGNITDANFFPLFECNVAESSSFLGKVRITELGEIRVNPYQSINYDTVIAVQIPIIFAK